MKFHQACLLLGSNIEPEKNLPEALELLSHQVPVERVSTVWETPAVGSNEPNFLNAAVLITTPYERDLLKERILRPIEAQLGRVRTDDKFAARPIDIDIVTWNNEILDKGLWEYAYLAIPVAELLPCFQSETGEFLGQVARRLIHFTPMKNHPEILWDFSR